MRSPLRFLRLTWKTRHLCKKYHCIPDGKRSVRRTETQNSRLLTTFCTKRSICSIHGMQRDCCWNTMSSKCSHAPTLSVDNRMVSLTTDLRSVVNDKWHIVEMHSSRPAAVHRHHDSVRHPCRFVCSHNIFLAQVSLANCPQNIPPCRHTSSCLPQSRPPAAVSGRWRGVPWTAIECWRSAAGRLDSLLYVCLQAIAKQTDLMPVLKMFGMGCPCPC